MNKIWKGKRKEKGKDHCVIKERKRLYWNKEEVWMDIVKCEMLFIIFTPFCFNGFVYISFVFNPRQVTTLEIP